MKKRRSSGITLLGALSLIFIVMKLLDVSPVSAWSWWWVTAPLWAGWGLMLVAIPVVAIYRRATKC